jgi:hypothetical protein
MRSEGHGLDSGGPCAGEMNIPPRGMTKPLKMHSHISSHAKEVDKLSAIRQNLNAMYFHQSLPCRAESQLLVYSLA